MSAVAMGAMPMLLPSTRTVAPAGSEVTDRRTVTGSSTNRSGAGAVPAAMSRLSSAGAYPSTATRTLCRPPETGRAMGAAPTSTSSTHTRAPAGSASTRKVAGPARRRAGGVTASTGVSRR